MIAEKKPKKPKPEPCGCFLQGPSTPLPAWSLPDPGPDLPAPPPVPIKVALAARAQGCFLCKAILQDLEQNRRLTGAPRDFIGAPVFTVKGQVRHLVIEGIFKLPLDVSILDAV